MNRLVPGVVAGGVKEHLKQPNWQIEVSRPHPGEKLAPCRATCPSHTDIRNWIAVIAQREKLGLTLDAAMSQAWTKLVEFNPFPAVLGRVCPHTCETQCNRINKDGAVSIHSLERTIGDWGIKHGLRLPQLDFTPQTTSIGVIGAGPASLSFAYQMARRGYPVTIYEQHGTAGGMLRYGIPHYRLPREVLNQEIARIAQLGVVFKFNTRIGEHISVAELRAQHAEIFIGIGADLPLDLDVPGVAGPHVFSGIQFLYRANEGHSIDLGHNVVVVGGGDTAVDAARIARRLGASVTLLYRRTEQEMPASREEISDARAEGVRLQFMAKPAAIIRADSRIVEIQVQRLQIGELESTGRHKLIPIPDDTYTIPVDTVIVAVSQLPDWHNLEDLHPVGGHAVINAYGQVSQGLWSGGDTVHMGTVAHAIGAGRLAAESLAAKLHNLPMPPAIENKPIHTSQMRLDSYPTRIHVLENRSSTKACLSEPHQEIRHSLTETQFLHEASRCLSCGNCSGCQYCWMYCNAIAYKPLSKPTPGAYFAFNPDACIGCGKCVELCPTGYLR